MLETENQVFC